MNVNGYCLNSCGNAPGLPGPKKYRLNDLFLDCWQTLHLNVAAGDLDASSYTPVEHNVHLLVLHELTLLSNKNAVSEKSSCCCCVCCMLVVNVTGAIGIPDDDDGDSIFARVDVNVF